MQSIWRFLCRAFGRVKFVIVWPDAFSKEHGYGTLAIHYFFKECSTTMLNTLLKGGSFDVVTYRCHLPAPS